MKKISFETFNQRLKQKYGNTFTISKSEYRSTLDPVSVYCNIHKESFWKKRAGEILQCNPCKYCAKGKKFHNYVKKFTVALKTYFPGYKLFGEITDFNSLVRLKCPNPAHDAFMRKSDAVIYNRTKCPQCRYEAATEKRTGSQRYTFAQYAEKFRKRYGNSFTLISKEKDYKNGYSILEATCGDPTHPPIKRRANDFLRYNGCRRCKESMGERLVRLALESLKIEYEKEKRFATCRDKKELPFDFWLPKFSTLIEFQGKQHKIVADRFGGEDALKSTKRRDKLKKEWADKNRINLILIEEYSDVKKTILKNLNPSENYNPNQVLGKIEEQERAWELEEWAKYKKRLERVHKGSGYVFSQTKWTRGQNIIEYVCPSRGMVSGDIFNLLQGHGCSLCANNKMTLEFVVERSRKKFGHQFDFSNAVFTGMEGPMEIVCSKHGKIKVSPNQHLRWVKGCKKCNDKAGDYSSEKFLREARKKFGKRFDYSNLGYEGATGKIVITCIEHNKTFTTRPHDHLRSIAGCCPICTSLSRRRMRSNPVTVGQKEFKSFGEAAEYYKIKPVTVRRRIKLGWTLQEAFAAPIKARQTGASHASGTH